MSGKNAGDYDRELEKYDIVDEMEEVEDDGKS